MELTEEEMERYKDWKRMVRNHIKRKGYSNIGHLSYLIPRDDYMLFVEYEESK